LTTVVRDFARIFQGKAPLKRPLLAGVNPAFEGAERMSKYRALESDPLKDSAAGDVLNQRLPWELRHDAVRVHF
jgi:hypothetical protein